MVTRTVRYKWVPVIDEERCTGCGLCVEACGPACLEMVEGIAVLVRPDACGSEEHCIEPCRDDAIHMQWIPMSGDEQVGRWKRAGAEARDGEVGTRRAEGPKAGTSGRRTYPMAERIRELDVRCIPPPRRHPEIFQTFDSLAASDAFVLVNDHDPKPLLYQFQVERTGQFDWSVLEAGPERFRIEIRRRGSRGPRNVTEFLERDHRRLDALLPDVARLLAAGAVAESADRFAEAACGLNWHIDAEEQVLFPAFEQATGNANGPTAVMRLEHAEIRRRLDAVREALDLSDPDATTRAIRELVETLSAHNVKEEQILYPLTDQAVGGERERDDLVRRMQAS